MLPLKTLRLAVPQLRSAYRRLTAGQLSPASTSHLGEALLPAVPSADWVATSRLLPASRSDPPRAAQKTREPAMPAKQGLFGLREAGG